MINCPQNADLTWKIEDSTGICAETQAGWLGWEYPDDNAQKSLGSYLDTFESTGSISPATSGGINNCRIQSASSWKNTSSVRADRSSGSIIVYYSGRISYQPVLRNDMDKLIC